MRKSPKFDRLAPLAALALTLVAPATATAAESVDFVRQIEPILIKRCSECHGPDQQKAKLRLDTRAEALKAGKSGKAALVPGQPEASELMHRVLSTDPDEVMPSKGARLTEEEVTALRQWRLGRHLDRSVRCRARYLRRLPAAV